MFQNSKLKPILLKSKGCQVAPCSRNIDIAWNLTGWATVSRESSPRHRKQKWADFLLTIHHPHVMSPGSFGTTDIVTNNSAPAQLGSAYRTCPWEMDCMLCWTSDWVCVHYNLHEPVDKTPLFSPVLVGFKHNDVLISLATTVIVEKLRWVPHHCCHQIVGGWQQRTKHLNQQLTFFPEQTSSHQTSRKKKDRWIRQKCKCLINNRKKAWM